MKETGDGTNRVGSQNSMRTGYQPAYRAERPEEV